MRIAEVLLFPAQSGFWKLNGTRRTIGREIAWPAMNHDLLYNLFFRAIEAELY
jgi:hypothetical protein